MKNRPRLLRITTVPISLKLLLHGQLTYMQQQGFDVLAVSAEGPEIQALRDDGVAHEVVAMTRKITPVQDLVALIGLCRVMRRFKPQIVHTHTPKAGLLGMLAAWICRVPIRLHTVAGLPLMESHGVKRRLLILTERITYACASHVYWNSRGLYASIQQEIKLKPVKHSVIGKGSSNGIDTDFFSVTEGVRSKATQLRAQHAIRPGERVFGFVGRIVTDKGINELVQAFEQVAQEIPSRLILVGPFEDDLDPVSEHTRALLERDSRIILLGYQNDVRPALAASDIFVFPSYREGFPNVVMQACAMGLPCIVSDINGCNEIIEHRKTGLIVKPKSAEALAEAMKELSAGEAQRVEFAAIARKEMVENFDQAYLWSLILAEYKKHLALCTSAS